MTHIKHILLSLLMLCNIILAYGKETIQSDSTQAVTVENPAQLKPIDIIKNPNILTDKWLTEPIPISQYTDEEKKLQTLINDKTVTAVKTYSTAAQDKEWVKYDHEAITPYTWKIIDVALTEANGKTNNVSLLRPNWWIRNIGADRLGNRFYLKIPEVAEGNAVVKAIRVNQVDTRLWDEQRNGDYVYRPITATFQHDSNNVLNLYFTNDEKPLGVTPEHRIYSMDKNDFVPAGSLSIGEKVKTYQGISTLVKKEKLDGTHKVYNIEVYRDHNYMVSMNSIVVHNDKAKAKVGSDSELTDNTYQYSNQEGSLSQIPPRTPNLGATSTTEKLLANDMPVYVGSEGIILEQGTVKFEDLWELSRRSGVEFVLTKENNQYVLRSGSFNRAPIPSGTRPIAHTHPKNEIGQNDVLPSTADINVLNDYWIRNPEASRPVSQIITEKNNTTIFRATGQEIIPTTPKKK